ncbi:MAG: XisI protein [Acidobacteria bacterium]|nr:XisI protein [Acidobacteriota bacterium]
MAESEAGIATDLEATGVPRDHIGLGFRHPDRRKSTDYAVA